MKICVVTVTYGDRFELLKQVIEASFKEGVNKVIVVDNASAENSRNKLMEFEEQHKDKMKVIYLNENTGSAGGFKRGLEEAYGCPDCEFIWLLDDDNMPLEGSLKALKDFWNSLEEKDKESKVALLSYRFKKENLAKVSIVENKPEIVLGMKNSFLGFHIKELHKKIFSYIKRLLDIKTNKSIQKGDIKYGIVPVAPYGGLFFYKNIINKIKYPNEHLYLYADDHEWSYRITKSGGKIFLVLDSMLDDLELSWHVPKSSKEIAFSIISKGDPFRVYYSVRNRVFFEVNNLVDSNIIYWINIFMYLFLISLSSTKNIKLIIKAIKDGYKGKLGKMEQKI